MATSTSWVGLRLENDRYHVLAELGAGGMATVYRARDTRLQADVVIKVPHKSLLDENPHLAARFRREVQSLVKLTHPHIVKVHDVGDYQGCPYAVLQYLPGGSLRDRLDQQGKMTPADLQTWLPDVAAALDHIHAQGYLHRDVKPDNILFDQAGHVFLSDFGVAKVLADVRPTRLQTLRTQTGAVVGTPAYMAPERLAEKQCDGRADQCS